MSDLGHLPPFLLETEPMEPEHMPLQLALITMEVARIHLLIAELNRGMEERCSLRSEAPSVQTKMDEMTGLGTEWLTASPTNWSAKNEERVYVRLWRELNDAR